MRGRSGPFWDALLGVRVVTEQVQREGERAGGGLVPGEQEQQHLRADLGVVKALAGVRVTDCQQPAEQIVAPGAWPLRRHRRIWSTT